MSIVSPVVLISIVLLFALGAVIAAPLLSRTDGKARSMAWVGAATMAALALVALLGDSGGVISVSWIESLGLELRLSIDSYSVIFLGLIGTVGAAVFVYSGVYFRSKPGALRFTAVMLAFAVAMAGIVISDDVFTLFIFWELTTFTSYLLIGHHFQLGAAARSARQAVLVTGAGGLSLLAGLIVLTIEAGTSNIGDLVASAPGSSFGWLLVLVGALTKSAQFPFHFWLPAAMAAPTPASAFLHSATMVKAGIILAGRLAPAAGVLEWWTPTVVGLGLATMVVGGYRALLQTDLKLLLAYGTVSQLGLMFALIGSGIPELMAAGLVVLIAHALYKSSLFLVVGVIDKVKGTRDLKRLSGLGREMPILSTVGLVAAASMAAIPLTLGFATKEAALEAALSTSVPLALLIAAASALTVAYSTRFVLGAFGGAGGERVVEPLGLIAPTGVLAAGSMALGFLPGVLGAPATEAVASTFGPFVGEPKLAIWPGFAPALGLSLAGLVLGSALGWYSVARWELGGGGRTHAFDRIVEGFQSAAERLTSVFQNGSLPAYLGQILAVAVVLPFPALVRLGLLPTPIPVGGPFEWLVGGLMVAAAITLLFVRRRMVAVLLLGALGYGMATLFAMGGAPDVALTQLLVETLVVAMFALALRILPLEFGVRFPFAPWKALVAVGAGGFAVVTTLAIGASSPAGTVSEEMLARSVPDAAGANVVNVILVDYRAADTLGEILVLGIAALGVLALVRPFSERVRREEFFGRPSPILSRGVTVVGPLLLVFSAYLLLAGHNQPGGGFAAGLVAAAWLVLRWLADGTTRSANALPWHPSALIGAGLALAVLIGIAGFLWSDGFLASQVWDLRLGPIGDVKVVSALVFDAGVAAVVVGSVAAAMRGLEGA